jgi:hypothetical protein
LVERALKVEGKRVAVIGPGQGNDIMYHVDRWRWGPDGNLGIGAKEDIDPRPLKGHGQSYLIPPETVSFCNGEDGNG